MNITIHTNKGPVTVKAHKVEGGLAIHPALDPAGPPGTFHARKVMISHVQSGLRVTPSFPSRKVAEMALDILLRAGNWDRPEDEVKYDEALQRAAAQVRDNPPKAPPPTPRPIPVLRTVERFKETRSVVWEEGGLTVECIGEPAAGRVYFITHDASGKKIGDGASRTKAIRRAKRLLPLVNWSLEEDALFRELNAREGLIQQVRQIAEGA